jgi:hypothetical protein
MPSPFPGMDPHLENPTIWPGVHQRIITYAGDRLPAAVTPRYYVEIGERVFLESSERDIYPDIALKEGREPAPARRAGPEATPSGSASRPHRTP